MDPRNFKIEGVELNWAKLDKPVSPFGTEQYELQIATKDKAKAEMLSANHLKVKEKNGVYTVSLRRKAKKANGEDNGKVRVVMSDLSPMENVRELGNGSIGNVIVFQYPWEQAGRSGIASSLTAIQVTELEIYKPDSVGFEAIGGSEEPAETQDPVSMF